MEPEANAQGSVAAAVVPAVRLAVQSRQTLSFALEQCGCPLITGLAIENTGDHALDNLFLQISLDPELGEPISIPIDAIAARGSFHADEIDYRLPAGKLRQVVELEKATLRCVLTADGEPIAADEQSVDVLPFNHWVARRAPYELLASFVLPNHPVVTQVLKQARAALRTATGSDAWDGYQSGTRERPRAMVAAIYETIQSLGVTYVTSPPSFGENGQKIRLPDQVLSDELGCCLDLTALMAACLEQAGLHAVLVLIKGHAFPAVWLVEDTFPEGVVVEAGRLRSLVSLGQVLALDSSANVTTPRVPFDEAIAIANRSLLDDASFEAAIDLAYARRGGFHPLPIRRVAEVAPTSSEDAPRATRTLLQLARSAEDEATTASIPIRVIPERSVPDRFRRWQERLLDLSLRNKLLSYRPYDNRGPVLPLVIANLARFEDRLASGAEILIQPPTSGQIPDIRHDQLAWDRVGEQRRAELDKGLEQGIVVAHCAADRLVTQAQRLSRDARLALEETGANTLFVSIAHLLWREDPKGELRRAPILLYPVDLKVDAKGRRIRFSRNADDPIFNVTLIEKMRRDFRVDIGGIVDFEPDESGLDVPKIVAWLRERVKDAGWEVEETAHLGLFSFTKFLLWKDLEENRSWFLENEVIRTIADPARRWTTSPSEVTAAQLDHHSVRTPCVVPTDSSQLSAVVRAQRGESFVLQGPPGTGKSQTITNLVATLLADGKSVLFVAEKMAALEVVHRRLSQAGLAPFCLELHSHKANKKDVIASLGTAFELAERVSPVDDTERQQQVVALQCSLNDYAEALHRTWGPGLSYFQVQSRIDTLSGHARLPVQLDGLADLTPDGFEAKLAVVGQFAEQAAAVGDPALHPFRSTNPADWSLDFEDEVRSLVLSANTALMAAEQACSVLAPSIHWATVSPSVWRSVTIAARAAHEGPIPESALSSTWAEVTARIDGYVIAKARLLELEAELGLRWTGQLVAAPLGNVLAKLERWANAFFLFAWLFLMSARRSLKPMARAALPTAPVLLTDVRNAAEARALRDVCEDHERSLSTVLSSYWSPVDGLAALSALRERAQRLRAAAQQLEQVTESVRPVARKLFDLARNPSSKERLGAVSNALHELDAALSALRERMGSSTLAPWPADDEEQAYARWSELARGFGDRLPELRAWCRLARAEREMETAQLGAICMSWRKGVFKAAQLEHRFRRAMYDELARDLRRRAPVLGSFDGKLHHGAVVRFDQKDGLAEPIAQHVVRHALESRLPARGAAEIDGSEPGLLARELRKKSKHLPIRKLVAQMPNLFPRLKPCLLMSPLSIAQYLPAGGKRFDVVVFDEASQIQTHDAIGAIARGSQVIVVGDSKQLPPTSFFARAASAEDGPVDENDQEELESILDEALAKGLNQQTLGWHYRSEHHSLIEFSNQHYYDDRLAVFPAAFIGRDDLGISWHRVQGMFLSGSDTEHPRTNPQEARALVDQLVGSLRAYSPEERTFGVVTFSLAQRLLIEEMLAEAQQQYPEIERHFSTAEHCFCKNLENVQGDERDEILFSIGYAKGKDGKLRMHFGPLSIAGGERRLNVAVTRARRKLRVFCSMDPTDLDLSRTNAMGARHLRSFLEFAAAQDRRASAASLVRSEEPITKSLRTAIESLGYEVHESVGSGSYRVDLAVVHPTKAGEFLAGIESDGVNYASARTCRDRDRLRRQVLEKLGWQLIRVWSWDWMYERPLQIERLRTRLKELEIAPTPARTSPSAPLPTPPNKAASMEAPFARTTSPVIAAPEPVAPGLRGMRVEPYRSATLATVGGSTAKLNDPLQSETIRAAIAQILSAEAPVHARVVEERVADVFEIQRLSEGARRFIRERMTACLRLSGFRYVGEFVWRTTDDPGAYRTLRTDSAAEAARELSEVPPEERALAIAVVLAQALSLDLDTLSKLSIEQLFVGGKRRREDETFAGALAVLERRGWARREGDRATWTGPDDLGSN